MEKKNDLRIKIGTKEEAFWTQIKEGIETELRQNKATIEMNELLLPFVEKKIKESK